MRRLFKLNKTRTIFGQFEFLWMNSVTMTEDWWLVSVVGDVLFNSVTHLLRYSSCSVRLSVCICLLAADVDSQLDRSIYWWAVGGEDDEETTGRSTPREFRYSNGHVLCLLIFQPVVVLDLFCSVLVPQFLERMCVVGQCFPLDGVWNGIEWNDAMGGGVVLDHVFLFLHFMPCSGIDFWQVFLWRLMIASWLILEWRNWNVAIKRVIKSWNYLKDTNL